MSDWVLAANSLFANPAARHNINSIHQEARQPKGTTNIDVVIVRERKNLKGHLLGFVLKTVGSGVGRGVLEKAFEISVNAIEARNKAARKAA